MPLTSHEIGDEAKIGEREYELAPDGAEFGGQSERDRLGQGLVVATRLEVLGVLAANLNRLLAEREEQRSAAGQGHRRTNATLPGVWVFKAGVPLEVQADHPQQVPELC